MVIRKKMRHGEFFDYTNDEGNASNVRARQLCARLQTMTLEDQDYRKVMEELIPGIPATTIVNPPFHYDHGHGIRLSENVFINYTDLSGDRLVSLPLRGLLLKV